MAMTPEQIFTAHRTWEATTKVRILGSRIPGCMVGLGC